MRRKRPKHKIDTSDFLIPKQHPVRDPEFLRWIASQACMKCKRYGRSQAAHMGKKGKGMKACDKSARPLCTVSTELGCHEKHDQYLEEDYWKHKRKRALDLPIYDLWEKGQVQMAELLLRRF